MYTNKTMRPTNSSFGPGRDSIPQRNDNNHIRKEREGLRHFDVIETIHRLEKEGKPDVDKLTEKLSQKHGREYEKEEVERQLEMLEKTPAGYKIVKRSLIGKKVSLTNYGRQMLEQ